MSIPVRLCRFLCVALLILTASSSAVWAQGVTTATIRGLVTDANGEPLPGANVIAVHEPSGTEYGASTRGSGTYTILNARVGGPYSVTASFVGFEPQTEEDITLNLGETFQLNFELSETEVALDELTVVAESDDIMNSDRTGAVTSVDPAEVARLPSIDRSTRDLIRTDPRNDGNLSFGGRNYLFNNLSVDGSYFNNPYGLDDPSPADRPTLSRFPSNP